MRRWALLLIAALAAAPARAADGTTAAASLKLGTGARGQALGDAHSAAADAVDALFWNPAGLAAGHPRSVALGFQPLVEGASLGHAAAAGRFGKLGVGLGFSAVNQNDLDGFDSAGNPSGSFKAQDQTAVVGAAMGGDAFSWGGAVKLWRSQIDGESAGTVALDLGLRFVNPFTSRLRHALVARHLGGKVSYIDQKDPLPTTGVFGSALRLGEAVSLSLDAVFERNAGATVGGGLAWDVVRSSGAALTLRGGYNTRRADTEDLGGISVGLGAGYRSISFDYAWVPFGELGDSHALTLTWKPSMEPRAPKVPRTPAVQQKPSATKGKIESGTTGRRKLDDLEAPRRRRN